MAAPKQEKNPIVFFTIDFETGGLKCQTAACTQIAIHATRLDTFERIGTFVRYIAPYRRKEIAGVGTPKRKTLKSKYETEETPMMDYEAKALEYSAITMKMLEDQGQDIVQVAQDALKFFQDHTPKGGKNAKPFLVGQNIEFDKGFLMQMMEYAGLTKDLSKVLRGHEDFYGHWQPDVLDTLIIGQMALSHLPEVNSYKLEIMCENLGIELDDAHDADADVTATTNVLAVATRRMRNTDEGDGGTDIALSKTEKNSQTLQNIMEENDIKPVGGPEPTVIFRQESDRDLYEIRNPEINESLIKITGYDLQFWFNPKYLKTVEDIEAACNGVHNLFRELIMEQMLDKSKQKPQE